MADEEIAAAIDAAVQERANEGWWERQAPWSVKADHGYLFVECSAFSSRWLIASSSPTVEKVLRWLPTEGLRAAATNDDVGAMKAAVEAGADIDDEESGYNPLYLAASKGKRKALEWLLAEGAEVEPEKWRPLCAAKNGTIVKLLVKAGAKLDRRSASGSTALHQHAANAGNSAIKALLAAGADPSIADDMGVTPLMRARTLKKKNAIALLSAAIEK